MESEFVLVQTKARKGSHRDRDILGRPYIMPVSLQVRWACIISPWVTEPPG